MPSIETSIWLALRARVEDLPLGLPIAWPNESFVKPTGGYLRVTWIPNLNGRPALNSNGTHRRLSLLQVDLFARKNENAAVVTDLAGRVAEHFPADLPMRAHGRMARVARAPEVSRPIPDDSHVMVAVTVPIEVMA